MTVVTRFAPSPTGDLHLGHAFAALFAHARARRIGGRFLVRIEDLDADRCRETLAARNLDDLRWLGLGFEEPVVRQSERTHLYRAALDRLHDLGVTYPCFCSRREIQAEIEAAGAAPHAAAGGTAVVYPGTCRTLDDARRHEQMSAGRPFALRLDAPRACRLVGAIGWNDEARGQQHLAFDRLGDVVIARKDAEASYHLAVVVDDADQGVTHVTRGEDLFEATHVHRMLYALLGLPAPVWHHHALVRDGTGRRLAKRHGDVTLRALRASGHTQADILAMARSGAGVPACEARAGTVGLWETLA